MLYTVTRLVYINLQTAFCTTVKLNDIGSSTDGNETQQYLHDWRNDEHIT